MTVPPRTPAEWLLFAADLAERHPMGTLTAAGTELQNAFIAFLRAGSIEQAIPLDLHADLITLLPRFHNALVSAGHEGAVCQACSSRRAAMIFDEIIRDARELAARQALERKH
jgi:hypothetical protein